MRVNKTQTIRDLKRIIESLEYLNKEYVIPYQEEVQKRKFEEMKLSLLMASGCMPTPDSAVIGHRIDQLKEAIKTVKKLKI